MDEEIERLVVSVRADTAAFAGDVAEMRGQIEGPLSAGVERAGRSIENALSRAIRTGKLGFDDLKRVALSVMAEIAASAISGGIGSIGGGGGGGGLLSTAATLLTSVLGAPGRATGGPLEPGGVVEFDVAPAEGAVLTAGFRFDVPVRFEGDRLEVGRATFLAGEAVSVPLVEIREVAA